MRNATLDEIGAAIGYSATRVLTALLGGGQPVYVPRSSRAGPPHPLARALGVDAFAALCKAFGGEMVYVPRDQVVPTARDLDVARRLAEGADLETVAAEFKLTVRRVRVLRSDLVDRGVLRWAGSVVRRGSGPRARLVALENLGTGEVFGDPPGGVERGVAAAADQGGAHGGRESGWAVLGVG